jgi:hypothetical protein
MAIDVYLRLPSDPNYNSNFVEVEDDVSNFVQQIEMILTTVPGEVLGSPDFGVNLEGYLWNSYVTSGSIKSDIMTQIRKYCVYNQAGIPFSVQVNFIKGDIIDGIVIDILIDGRKILGISATPNPNQQISLNP